MIANVENAASGAGITRETGDALLKSRRRRHDDGQPRVGQARGALLHRRRAPPAAAAEHGVRRAGPRRVRRPHGGRAARSA
ncbi:MAG: hypothetical protein MZV64_28325 [Ignavibacteriales bacterium]|nr:hypothetical protein [Ignavibacteriales bacterium]